MFRVNNKFDIDEEVYLIKQVPVKYDCPVCKGEGKFIHNGYEIKCSKCRGEGKLLDDKVRIWEVMDGTYKIYSIKVCHNGSCQTIRYKVSGFNRAETNIFKTKEDAEKKCLELNTGCSQELNYSNTEDTSRCDNCIFNEYYHDEFVAANCNQCVKGLHDFYSAKL